MIEQRRVRFIVGAAAAVLSLFPIALHAGDLPQCEYSPTWKVFQEGRAVVEPVVTHNGPRNEPNTRDGYRILLPAVAQPYKAYDAIPLFDGDELVFDACGCVQTGGQGLTWKRYVDPRGDDSDRYYHGVIVIDGALSVTDVQVRTWNRGATFRYVRVEDVLQAQDRAIAAHKSAARIRVTKRTVLKLGYEDDDYGDNGYSGHDNGNDDQCANVGGAVVEVIATHH